jgi:DNA-directed RNA polymerase subunit alpha
MNDYLSRPIDDIDMPVRVYDCLKRLGVKTIRELAQKTSAELLREPNFGSRSLSYVEGILKAMGLKLRSGRYQPQNVDKPKQAAVVIR